MIVWLLYWLRFQDCILGVEIRPRNVTRLSVHIARISRTASSIMEGWTVLSALAAVTNRIRLATLATSVYRNPAHLAKIAAGSFSDAGCQTPTQVMTIGQRLLL